MSWPGLPILVGVAGRAVMLVGEGEAADAKRRLLERAGARIVGEGAIDARLAIVAPGAKAEVEAVAVRLRARGMLVNVVDRADLCDFTVPAIVDRSPVLVAVMTGGVSAGLAAALRQRIEAWLPASLGALATALGGAKGALRRRWPDGDARRRAIGAALAPGCPLDPFAPGSEAAVAQWLADADAPAATLTRIVPRSADPDDLTLREARALALADRVYHRAATPTALLDRARADAVRIVTPGPVVAPPPGANVDMDGL